MNAKMTLIENKIFDEERALYSLCEIVVKNCTFSGPADGESAIKECQNVRVENSRFELRYPFWHNDGVSIISSELAEGCRAALWYSKEIEIKNSLLLGVKALRECSDVYIDSTSISSPEFGWSVKNIRMKDCTASGEYFMLRSENVHFENTYLDGKYSFQYIKNAMFENCEFNTKDALWHAENVTLKNCTVRGEYLAWYSKNVTFINCKITGTQPFCYCSALHLVDCEINDAYLAFEKSDVTATLTAPVISIKNPYSGSITLPSVGEIIINDPKARCQIKTWKK